MKVTVKLTGTLGKYLPPNAQGNEVEVELSNGETITSLIKKIGFPAEQKFIVSVNNDMVPASLRDTHVIQSQDQVTLIPPLKGG